MSTWIDKFKTDPVGTIYHRYFLDFVEDDNENLLRGDIALFQFQKIDEWRLIQTETGNKYNVYYVNTLENTLHDCYKYYNRVADGEIKELENAIKAIKESKF